MKRSIRIRDLLIASSLFGLLAKPAFAQNSEPAAAESEAEGVQDIIVTAQKRSERLQEIPISITSMTGDALTAKGVNSTIELASTVSGLTVTTSAGSALPRIRGVGTGGAVAGNENSVAIYVDGVYYASSFASTFGLADIQQIDVLKGPQGTLFGRNATGGVIQITTREPSEEASGKVSFTYGNLDTVGGSLYATAGIAEGVSASIAVQANNQDDSRGINLFNGLKVGTTRDFSARAKLKAELGPDTVLRLSGDYAYINAALPAYRPAPGSTPNLAGGLPFSGRTYDVNSNVQPLTRIWQWGTSANLSHQFDSFELVSISAYRKSQFKGNLDNDGLPYVGGNVSFTGPESQFTQEIRLGSTGKGDLKWVVGGYFFDSSGGFAPLDFVSAVPGPFVLNARIIVKTRAYAGFAQATYNLLPKTAVTLGIRYSSERKDLDAQGAIFGFPLPPQRDNFSQSKVTYRVALDHRLTDDILLYASYNTGFKSGGYDANPSVFFPATFKPETIGATEIGIKSDWLDRALRINFAAFHYDYKNVQLVTYASGTGVFFNGSGAKIKGFDLDITAVPVSGLTLTATANLTDSSLGAFPYTGQVPAPGGGNVTAPINVTGNSLPATPKFSFSLGAAYEVPVGNGMINFSANYSHSSRWYAEISNRAAQNAYGLVNLSAAWHPKAEGNLSFTAWVKNLGDVAYAAQLFEGGYSDGLTYAPGRTYGLTVSSKF